MAGKDLGGMWMGRAHALWIAGRRGWRSGCAKGMNHKADRRYQGDSSRRMAWHRGTDAECKGMKGE